jgi:hypothetical protein
MSVVASGPARRGDVLASVPLPLHDWFTDLAGDDQRFVLEVARDAAHAAVFGLLCVLDGVRAIDDPPHEQLRLVSVTPDGTETILNPEGSDLHDRLNALVHPPTERWPRP